MRWHLFYLFATAFAVHCAATQPPKPEAVPESFVYRDDTNRPLSLFVFKPHNWQESDRRPVLVWFFGGGWTSGTPSNAFWTARWAASLGLVGIAPDYRIKSKDQTTPLEAVDDARLAVRWVQENAMMLGVDPKLLVVGGGSAGGLLALWTALPEVPPNSVDAHSPIVRPVAILLTSAVSDTSTLTGYTPERFGGDAETMSPVSRVDAQMPPCLIFHGDADQIVPFRQSVALCEKLKAVGATARLVSIRGGSHNYGAEIPGWADRTHQIEAEFLRTLGILPVQSN